MEDFTMVIPSYWGSAGQYDKTGQSAETVVFDHPTTLDSRGTLGRLLESLDIFDSVPGRIVIIAVANRREIAREVEDKIGGIIAPFRKRYDIVCLGRSTLDKIIRKLAGILNGSRYTVFIDDDEVFGDSDFLKKIDENLGRSHKGDTIEALAGYYLQPDTYILDESKVPGWRAPYWNNAAAMNRAFERIIGRGERLKPTPFVFGGNMTVALEALQKVPFDPRITRGEDIDFLLNLRINGITFYLDRQLAITHLPPGSDQPAWKKVREDAVRFLYERKKVRDHPELSLEDLQPYPGLFLGDDLEERVIKTCELLKSEYESEQDAQGVRECENIIAMIKEDPCAGFDTRSWLAQLTADWREVTAWATGAGIPE